MYCGQLVWHHSSSGNAYADVVHLDPKTNVMCHECGMKIGAARAEYEYDECFVFDGRFFRRWTTYWITWRRPTAREHRRKYVKKFGRSSRYFSGDAQKQTSQPTTARESRE
jgi:hypothetical protein